MDLSNWPETVTNGLAYLRKLGRHVMRDRVLTYEGRSYIYDDADQRYKPMLEPRDEAEHAPNVGLLDVGSLSKWAHAMDGEMVHGTHDVRGQIVVSRTGTTEACTPIFIGPDTRREVATKPFFKGFLPGGRFSNTFDYVAFLTWIELLGPERLEGYDALLIATKSVSASEGAVVKVENDGAFMKVHTEGSKGAKGSAPVPKALDTTIPFGDPGCELHVRFRLVITHERGVLRFTVEHVSTDGAFDAYVAWMLAQLTDDEASDHTVPPGWTVLAAP